ncbi:hypothetical protein ON058_04025 [Demequina sp. B12]|uniref:hypothetical protein n=1 Tax=Demequina sp. B12 TaxID=2992757 RepID=UPI00237A98A7|nr:hypothetical protein [Demequina sp. B12]MDE0572578.1 hypothetical protein [Demequina sp. B12]
MDKGPSLTDRFARPVAIGLVAVEALALLVFAALNTLEAVLYNGTDLALAVAVTLAIFAVALAFAARALQRGQRWARSYTIMWQILQVASCVLLFSDAPVLASIAIVVGLVCLVAVVLDAVAEMPDE